MAKARDLMGADYNVVAVIGDGSISGGLAFEGFDNLAELGTGVIVIVNDNGWSIAENHGWHLSQPRRVARERRCRSQQLLPLLGARLSFPRQRQRRGRPSSAPLLELRDIDHPVVLHVMHRQRLRLRARRGRRRGLAPRGPFDIESGIV